MRSLRAGMAIAAFAMMWSGSAFGFSLFGLDFSSDKAKAEPQAAQAGAADTMPVTPMAESQSAAKTLAANLDNEIVKARAQRQAGDFSGAARALAQLMLVSADDPRILGEYGKVMVAQGRSDDAVAFLKRALELSPNDWTLYSAVGAAYDQKNDFNSARTAYQRGLQLRPSESALLNNYAMSRMLAGDLPGALQLISQAQANGSDPKIAHNAALMASLRGANQESMVTPATAGPVPAPVRQVATAPIQPVIQPAPVVVPKPAPVAVAAIAPVKPVAKPVVEEKPVAVAKIETPKPVVTPTPVAAAPVATPKVVKTAQGRVMMQAVPKDPEAGPMFRTTTDLPELASDMPRGLDLSSLSPGALARSTYPMPSLRSAAD